MFRRMAPVSIAVAILACSSSKNDTCHCDVTNHGTSQSVACGTEACVGGRSFQCMNDGVTYPGETCSVPSPDTDAGAGCTLGRPPKSSDCCHAYVLENNGWCSPACDPTHPCPTGYACTPASTADAGVCAPECSTDAECQSPVQWASCDRDLGACSN